MNFQQTFKPGQSDRNAAQAPEASTPVARKPVEDDKSEEKLLRALMEAQGEG